MATFVGKVGDTYHYSDARLGIFFYQGLHLTMRLRGAEPFILIEDLGRVKNSEEAIDKVARIVERARYLAGLKDEDG